MSSGILYKVYSDRDVEGQLKRLAYEVYCEDDNFPINVQADVGDTVHVIYSAEELESYIGFVVGLEGEPEWPQNLVEHSNPERLREYNTAGASRR